MAQAQVLSALQTLSSAEDRSQKETAHKYLEQFQKSPDAWSETFSLLQSNDATPEAKLFAAQTLKGKIVFDIHQIPRESLPSLRETLISVLASVGAGPKPLRTQICLCLANLAINMTEWKDVIQLIISKLGNEPQSLRPVLEFLVVLPEEVTEGRKINLSEEELMNRTQELLGDNVEEVVQLLVQASQASASSLDHARVLDCITSWLREIPMNDVVNTSILDIILNGLSSEDSFESAVECLSAIFRETKEVDESLGTIQTLYPRILSLRPQLARAAAEVEDDQFEGLTRIFAEAGEAWVVLICRMPEEFRDLVEAILECAIRDKWHNSVAYTYAFWFEMKQYLTLDNFVQARNKYADIFSQLVDVMITHLQYPKPEDGNDSTDLFDGDREEEEKFRQARHYMGDVLKDSCEVIGPTICLEKLYEQIDQWVQDCNKYPAGGGGPMPSWQSLEAPLFGMRAMGRMVPADESAMLSKLIPVLVQTPDHEKVRFQAVMALGRYTEWTAQHPDTLQPQLDFIMAAFNHNSTEVVKAAALSFAWFCADCADLLKDYMPQLQQFYESVVDRLPHASQEEVTEGVSAVLAKQPADQTYKFFKLTCDPVVKKLMDLAQNANDDHNKFALADKLQLVTIFVQHVQPYVESDQQNPAIQYIQEIFPILSSILDHFTSFVPILERICRCWRYMILSYRTAMAPLLAQMADKLAAGFTASKQGCFLWATDAIIREFRDGAEPVDQGALSAIFRFFEQQATTFLQALSDLVPEELPDVIEDFFRLAIDVLLYHTTDFTQSSLMQPIFQAATSSLTLLKEEPLMATLHFFRDFIAYGGQDVPASSFDEEAGRPRTNPPEVQSAVKNLVLLEGEVLTQRIMTGMMYTFPRDCFPDASGVMLALFQLIPQQAAEWVKQTISMVPEGSITAQESQRLLASVDERIQSGDVSDMRKIRSLLQDFTNSYRRRNVAPREGLGRLEATRFRFTR